MKPGSIHTPFRCSIWFEFILRTVYAGLLLYITASRPGFSLYFWSGRGVIFLS
jgi:hypothetical protein